ncbi:MAG: chlorite dismutase family protein [Thermomicrobiales bacterium]
MSEQRNPTVYANFWIYGLDREWRKLSEQEREYARNELAGILCGSEDSGVTLRGAYSTVGLRHDADMILWTVTTDLDAMQQLAVDINRSELGKYLENRYTYLGIALGSRYTTDHAPAFIAGTPPKRYLSVYPFIKSHDWYQMPFEERRKAMAEHGVMGREYPDILTNTTSAFGIADHEFVVALETDDLEDMVKMVEYLRSAASRPYTTVDTPIFLGVLKDVEEVLADLG